MPQSRTGRIVALVLLLAVGMLLGALHKRAAERRQPFFIEQAIRSVLSPFQSAIHSVARAGSGVTKSLRGRKRVMRENRRLRREVLRLSKENAALREERAENLRLRASLDFKQDYPTELLSARVISRGASRWRHAVTIDRGWRDGVGHADVVVTPRGLVGQVFDVGPSVSQVLLLTDQSSGVGALIQRSRVFGVCRGRHTPNLVMDYIDKDADIKAGDIVVSSGDGGVYPKGIPVGRVARIEPSGGLLKAAEIRPSVRFGQLEEAFVIVPEKAD